MDHLFSSTPYRVISHMSKIPTAKNSKPLLIFFLCHFSSLLWFHFQVACPLCQHHPWVLKTSKTFAHIPFMSLVLWFHFQVVCPLCQHHPWVLKISKTFAHIPFMSLVLWFHFQVICPLCRQLNFCSQACLHHASATHHKWLNSSYLTFCILFTR